MGALHTLHLPPMLLTSCAAERGFLGSLFDSSTASVHLHPGPTLRRPVALSPCRPVALLPVSLLCCCCCAAFHTTEPIHVLSATACGHVYKYMYSYTLPL